METGIEKFYILSIHKRGSNIYFIIQDQETRKNKREGDHPLGQGKHLGRKDLTATHSPPRFENYFRVAVCLLGHVSDRVQKGQRQGAQVCPLAVPPGPLPPRSERENHCIVRSSKYKVKVK